MVVEKEEKRRDFTFRHIGKNHIVIYPHRDVYTNSFLTMTGAELKVYIDIPYCHRLVKLVLIHHTSAHVKSEELLAARLELEAGRSSFSKYFADVAMYNAFIPDAEYIEPFGEGYEYEPRTWTLTLNTVSTDLVMPLLYIQKED